MSRTSFRGSPHSIVCLNESRGTHNTNNQLEFKLSSMLSASLCNYSGAYILLKGSITVPNTAAARADASNTNKKVIFKNCVPFTGYISRINTTQIDNVHYQYIDVLNVNV